MKISWREQSFEELSTTELYAILHLRQQVFIVEQQCIYQDCDGRDKKAHHLTGWYEAGDQLEPIAYLRIVYPEITSNSISIGRVLTHPNFRRRGIGRKIMAQCLLNIEKRYPESAIFISAQQYLIGFYESFNFHISSEGYQEDGIPHIRMTRQPSK
ncbi:MAG: GNAT family N-acetyltransferase [Desulforhopalus sp.]